MGLAPFVGVTSFVGAASFVGVGIAGSFAGEVKGVASFAAASLTGDAGLVSVVKAAIGAGAGAAAGVGVNDQLIAGLGCYVCNE